MSGLPYSPDPGQIRFDTGPVVAAFDAHGNWHIPGGPEGGRFAKPGWSGAKSLAIHAIRGLFAAEAARDRPDGLTLRLRPDTPPNLLARLRAADRAVHAVWWDDRHAAVTVDGRRVLVPWERFADPTPDTNDMADRAQPFTPGGPIDFYDSVALARHMFSGTAGGVEYRLAKVTGKSDGSRFAGWTHAFVDGQQVGEFQWRVDKVDNEIEWEHAWVDPKVRRTGVSSSIIQHANRVAADMGIRHVVIGASDRGTVAWAAPEFGLRFDPDGRGNYVRQALDRSDRPELRALAARFDGPPDTWPTPAEIRAMPGGRKVLADAGNWVGIGDLHPSADTNDLVDFQPRLPVDIPAVFSPAAERRTPETFDDLARWAEDFGVRGDWRYRSVTAGGVGPSVDIIEVTGITAGPTAPKGAAATYMKMLGAMADWHGVTIVAAPSPDLLGDKPGSYRRFGFSANKGKPFVVGVAAARDGTVPISTVLPDPMVRLPDQRRGYELLYQAMTPAEYDALGFYWTRQGTARRFHEDRGDTISGGPPTGVQALVAAVRSRADRDARLSPSSRRGGDARETPVDVSGHVVQPDDGDAPGWFLDAVLRRPILPKHGWGTFGHHQQIEDAVARGRVIPRYPASTYEREWRFEPDVLTPLRPADRDKITAALAPLLPNAGVGVYTPIRQAQLDGLVDGLKAVPVDDRALVAHFTIGAPAEGYGDAYGDETAYARLVDGRRRLHVNMNATPAVETDEQRAKVFAEVTERFNQGKNRPPAAVLAPNATARSQFAAAVAHEIGHVVDFTAMDTNNEPLVAVDLITREVIWSTGTRDGDLAVRGITPDTVTSPYGDTAPMEAFAEAYSQHYTGIWYPGADTPENRQRVAEAVAHRRGMVGPEPDRNDMPDRPPVTLIDDFTGDGPAVVPGDGPPFSIAGDVVSPRQVIADGTPVGPDRNDMAVFSSDDAVGDCFSAAVDTAEDLEASGAANVRVVHGYPVYQGDDPRVPAGSRIAHAWVEYDQIVDVPEQMRAQFGRDAVTVEMVVDRSNGNNVELPRGFYYAVGQINEADVARYTLDEAQVNMVRSRHYGPWADPPDTNDLAVAPDRDVVPVDEWRTSRGYDPALVGVPDERQIQFAAEYGLTPKPAGFSLAPPVPEQIPWPVSGSTGVDQAVAAVRQVLADAAADARNGKVVVRVDPEAVDGIIRTGRVMSQHESGRSLGAYAPAARVTFERTAFGIPDSYPAESRPVYGYVAADNTITWAAGQYGPVGIVLRGDVTDRSTLSLGDSLGFAVPVPAPSVGTATAEQVAGAIGHIGAALVGNYLEGRPPESVYVEAQVHGGVSTGDIAGVIAFGPEGRSAADRLAAAVGVPVFDAPSSETELLAVQADYSNKTVGRTTFGDLRAGWAATDSASRTTPSMAIDTNDLAVAPDRDPASYITPAVERWAEQLAGDLAGYFTGLNTDLVVVDGVPELRAALDAWNQDRSRANAARLWAALTGQMASRGWIEDTFTDHNPDPDAVETLRQAHLATVAELGGPHRFIRTTDTRNPHTPNTFGFGIGDPDRLDSGLRSWTRIDDTKFASMGGSIYGGVRHGVEFQPDEVLANVGDLHDYGEYLIPADPDTIRRLMAGEFPVVAEPRTVGDVWRESRTATGVTASDAAATVSKRSKYAAAHTERLVDMLRHVERGGAGYSTNRPPSRLEVKRVASKWPLSGAVIVERVDDGTVWRLRGPQGPRGRWTVTMDPPDGPDTNDMADRPSPAVLTIPSPPGWGDEGATADFVRSNVTHAIYRVWVNYSGAQDVRRAARGQVDGVTVSFDSGTDAGHDPIADEAIATYGPPPGWDPGREPTPGELAFDALMARTMIHRVNQSPPTGETTYRGVTVDDDAYERLMADAVVGNVVNVPLMSTISDRLTAEKYVVDGVGLHAVTIEIDGNAPGWTDPRLVGNDQEYAQGGRFEVVDVADQADTVDVWPTYGEWDEPPEHDTPIGVYQRHTVTVKLRYVGPTVLRPSNIQSADGTVIDTADDGPPKHAVARPWRDGPVPVRTSDGDFVIEPSGRITTVRLNPGVVAGRSAWDDGWSDGRLVDWGAVRTEAWRQTYPHLIEGPDRNDLIDERGRRVAVADDYAPDPQTTPWYHLSLTGHEPAGEFTHLGASDEPGLDRLAQTIAARSESSESRRAVDRIVLYGRPLAPRMFTATLTEPPMNTPDTPIPDSVANRLTTDRTKWVTVDEATARGWRYNPDDIGDPWGLGDQMVRVEMTHDEWVDHITRDFDRLENNARVSGGAFMGDGGTLQEVDNARAVWKKIQENGYRVGPLYYSNHGERGAGLSIVAPTASLAYTDDSPRGAPTPVTLDGQPEWFPPSLSAAAVVRFVAGSTGGNQRLIRLGDQRDGGTVTWIGNLPGSPQWDRSGDRLIQPVGYVVDLPDGSRRGRYINATEGPRGPYVAVQVVQPGDPLPIAANGAQATDPILDNATSTIPTVLPQPDRNDLPPRYPRLTEAEAETVAFGVPAPGWTPDAYDSVYEERAAHADRATMQAVRDDVLARPAIVVPADALVPIIEQGRFATQHETGVSNGAYDPKYRAANANTTMGVPTDLPVEERVVHGLVPTAEALDNADMYGDSVIFLRPDRVHDRVTFTIGDSLDTNAVPIWPDEVDTASPRRLAAAVSNESQDYPRRYTEIQVHGGVTLDDIAAIGVNESAGVGNTVDDLRAWLDSIGHPDIDVFPVAELADAASYRPVQAADTNSTAAQSGRLARLFDDPNVTRIIDRYNTDGHPVYIVGGALRSILNGEEPNDIDLTTPAFPEQSMEMLRDVGTVYPLGEKFGTVVVNVDDLDYEVTTHRTETYNPDTRKPEVGYTTSLVDDLGRRDFTVNAMAVGADRVLIDPFGGQADLEAGIIRAVGNPADRFTEDPLRVVRAVRFAATLGFTIDPATEAAAKATAAAGRLGIVSRERFNTELDKILKSPRRDVVENAVRLAEATGALDALFGPLAPAARRAGTDPRFGDVAPEHRFAALVWDAHTHGELPDPRSLVGDMKRGRADMADLSAVVAAADEMTAASADPTLTARRVVRRLPDQRLDTLRAIQPDRWAPGTPGDQAYTQRNVYRAPLPVDGKDVAALGMKGPDIGAALSRVTDELLRRNGPLSRDTALRVAAGPDTNDSPRETLTVTQLLGASYTLDDVRALLRRGGLTAAQRADLRRIRDTMAAPDTNNLPAAHRGGPVADLPYTPGRQPGDEFSGWLARQHRQALEAIRQQVIADAEEGFADDPPPLDEFTAEIADALRQGRDDGDMVIRVPWAAVPSIAADRAIKSQHETGTSQGAVNTVGRTITEAGWGIPADLPAELRPVYGSIESVYEEGAYGSTQYGPVQFVLKPEIADRVTVTYGDSLDFNLTPIPITGDVPDDQTFTAANQSAVISAVDALYRPDAEQGEQEPGHYREIQVHGGVTLDMIEAVYYDPTEPPPPEALQALRDAGLNPQEAM